MFFTSESKPMDSNVLLTAIHELINRSARTYQDNFALFHGEGANMYEYDCEFATEYVLTKYVLIDEYWL